MSLLSILTASAGPGVPLDPDPSDPVVPYDMPTTAPWNAPVYAVTPTPDETGSVIHPSVVDLGVEGWNGWRYWMAVTPFFEYDVAQENPCILVSANGFHWQVPAGLTNPIDPWPGEATDDLDWFNSDTDITYDPDTNELIVIWRESISADPSPETIWLSRSADGVTWSTPVSILTASAPGSNIPQKIISPALVRVDATDWRLFTASPPEVRTATTPEGPWSAPAPLYPGIVDNIGAAMSHIDVTYVDGLFYAIGHDDGYGVRVAKSVPGLDDNFIAAPPVLTEGTGRWDNTYYRPTITPHENGTHFRVWYAGNGSAASWRVGYTQIPRSAWDL